MNPIIDFYGYCLLKVNKHYVWLMDIENIKYNGKEIELKLYDGRNISFKGDEEDYVLIQNKLSLCLSSKRIIGEF